MHTATTNSHPAVRPNRSHRRVFLLSYFSNHTAEEAMQEFFGLQPLETRYPKYECLCSRDYIERLLLSLGKAECEDILKEQGKIHISCQFCNTVYSFDEKDVTALFGGANE